jgi:glycosyltransferase involved in cell wall biosynthesis
MEEFTLTLLDLLENLDHDISWTHVDTSINRRLDERGRFRLHKLGRLAQQMAAGTRLAAQGYDAYYQISQNRVGLIRDLFLLLPFRVARRRLIVHLHGGLLDTYLRDEAKILALLLRWALKNRRNRGIVLTQSLRHCLMPLLPVDRITPVANTAKVPAWTRRKSFDGTLHVLYVGSFIDTKGYLELAGAVNSLAERGLPIELDLVGEAVTQSDADAVETIATHPTIHVRGVLTGDEKWQVFQKCHVLALPTRYPPEGQPISIIEAMAAGCAIVATRREGIVDTLSDEEAVLIEPEEGEALQANLERVLTALIEDYPEVERKGRAASKRFDEALTPPQFFRRWVSAVTS